MSRRDLAQGAGVFVIGVAVGAVLVALVASEKISRLEVSAVTFALVVEGMSKHAHQRGGD